MGNIPTWDFLIKNVPLEIKTYINKSKVTPQSPKWHPEGNNYIHTRLVFDRAVKTGDLNMVIAALVHDLGKVDVTKLNKKGNYAAYGHEYVSAKLVKKYKDWIENFLNANFEEVYELVNNHMRIKFYDEMRSKVQNEFQKNPYFKKIKEFSELDNMTTLTDEELNRYK